MKADGGDGKREIGNVNSDLYPLNTRAAKTAINFLCNTFITIYSRKYFTQML